MLDTIKYLINKGKRVLPFTSAKAVITEKGTSVELELDSLREDIQYYIDMYNPDYIERLATSARYAREQGWFANEQGQYIKNNLKSISASVENSNYAKEQGNYAKEQGAYAKKQGDYIAQNKTAIDDSIKNSNYAKTQGDRAKEYADYISENKTAIDTSVENSENAYIYGQYARGYKNYIDTIGRRLCHGSRIFNVPEPTLPDTQSVELQSD